MSKTYPDYGVKNIYFVDNETLRKIRGYSEAMLTKEQKEALEKFRESLKSRKSKSKPDKKE